MVQSSLMHRLSWLLKTLLLLLLLSYSCLNIVVTARSDCLLCHGNSVVAQWVECRAIGRTVPSLKPPQSPHCYLGAADHVKTFSPTPGHTASPVLSRLLGRLDPIVLKPFDLAQVCHENKICSKLALTWKLTLEYGPVTMIVPASGHQVRCIPWVQMGTFNKDISFWYGLKFFALNIFCGEYQQSSLQLMLEIWWKPLLWKMCQ